MHPSLQGILEETYGIMVYQEQVMQLAQILAGYTLGGADLLRRAMGKKIKEAMDAERAKFVEGSKRVSEVSEEKSGAIFDQVAKFAGYGFNKSHAAAYSLIAYQTGYLKANYPVEFMASTLTYDMGNTDKINFFSQDLRNWKIKLLTPDINKSRVMFSVEKILNADTGKEEKAIRYALGAIKGVGAAAMDAIVSERNKSGAFKDINDFMRRVDFKSFSRKQLEVLAMAGAFDCFGLPRARIAANADGIMRQAQKWYEEKNSGQVNLFGGGSDTTAEKLMMDNTPEWASMERLDNEQSAIGFYLSAHPLDGQQELLSKNKYINYVDLKDRQYFESMNRSGSNRANLAGVVVKKIEKQSDRGRYAFVTLSDRSGLYDVTLYTEALALYRDMMTDGNLVSVAVEVTYREDEPRLILKSAQPLDQAMENQVREITIKAERAENLDGIEKILCPENRKGRVKIFLEITVPEMNKTVRYQMDGLWNVPMDDLAYLKTLPGVTVAVA